MEQELHREYKTAVERLCIRNSWRAYREVQLPNNKIADIVAINSSAKILIFEVKTTLNVSLIKEAIKKYARYCDGLYLVSDYEHTKDILEQTNKFQWSWGMDNSGFIGVHRGECHILQAPRPREPTNTIKLAIAETLLHHAPTW